MTLQDLETTDSVNQAYENLANAIVRQACDDYAALKRGKKRPGVHMPALVAFFKSSWAGMLCGGVDPLYILQRVEKEGMTDAARQPRKRQRVAGIKTIGGETHTIAEWSEITGINKSTLNNRLRAGWSDEEFFSPPDKNRKNKKERRRLGL